MRTNTFKCRNCGTMIYLDDEVLSPSGKKIPLDDADDQPHECEGRDSPDPISKSQDAEALKRVVDEYRKQLEAMGNRISQLEAIHGKDIPLQRLLAVEQGLFELRQLFKNKLL